MAGQNGSAPVRFQGAEATERTSPSGPLPILDRSEAGAIPFRDRASNPAGHACGDDIRRYVLRDDAARSDDLVIANRDEMRVVIEPVLPIGPAGDEPAHPFTGWARRIAVRIRMRFQTGLSAVSASAARVFVPSVSMRSRTQPFENGYDSVARSASTTSTAASIA